MTSVCNQCIGEAYLQNYIAKNGAVGHCCFCGNQESPVIELPEIAANVDSALEEHFTITSPEPEGVDVYAAREGNWIQPGEPVTDVISYLLDADEEVAEAIREILSDRYAPHGKSAMFEDDPYDAEAQYEERETDSYEFREGWSFFRHEIESRSRFFNQNAKNVLDDLFEGAEKLSTYEGDPVTRVFKASDSIFRARLAKTAEDLKNILRSAPASLAAPPGRIARAGRMNADGISVFYGATDAETCVTELRPPVGSYVVIGEFRPVKELRLLDFSRLARVLLRGSLFDPDHSRSLSRVAFLRQLESEISRPVLPGSESRLYIATQVVAEYLGGHPEMNLDGICFSSSQTVMAVQDSQNDDEDQDDDENTESEDGKNVVLFPHACGLRFQEHAEKTRISVQVAQMNPEEEPWPEIWVVEKVVENETTDDAGPSRPDPLEMLAMFEPDYEPEVQAPREISIELAADAIEVRKILGVQYATRPLHITRVRSNSENPDF